MDKRIIVRYVGGGTKDGQVLDSQAMHDPISTMMAKLSLVNLPNKKVGDLHWEAANSAIDAMRTSGSVDDADTGDLEYFRVTDRQETDEAITLTLTFVGNQQPAE